MSSIQEAMRKARAEREGEGRRPAFTAGYALPESSRKGHGGKKAWRAGVALVLLVVVGAAFYLRGGSIVSGLEELGRSMGLVQVEAPVKGEVQEGPKGVPSEKGGSSDRVAGTHGSGHQPASRTGQEARGTKARQEAPRGGQPPNPPVSRGVQGQQSAGHASVRQGEGRAPGQGLGLKPQADGQAGTQDKYLSRAERAPTVREAKRMRREGDVQGAEAMLKALLERNPTDVEAKVALANLYLQDLQDPQMAFPLYQHALSLAPERVPVQVNIGVYYIKVGNLNKAEEHLRRALALSPSSAEAHYNLACVYALRGDVEAAQQSLRRASEIDPRCSQWAQEDPDLASLRSTAGPQHVDTKR
ncbi:MAG: TPR end-of-group domain-containing protein [Thermodesulfobacteriota bacterium]